MICAYKSSLYPPLHFSKSKLKFMIFITFKTRDKTYLKIEKAWFLFLLWVTKSSNMNGKMMFILIYLSKTNHQLQQFPHIRHDQCLLLLCYLHQKIMQKKSDIFKKRNFLGPALDFLQPRKPGLYISRVDFFFFEYHELLKLLKY